MSVFAQKFGHFKSMDIIPVMPEYSKAQKDIQAIQQQYEDEIKRASDEFNKKFAEYQQEQSKLPQNIQERRQKELQEMQEKGMQFQQEAQDYEQYARRRFLERVVAGQLSVQEIYEQAEKLDLDLRAKAYNLALVSAMPESGSASESYSEPGARIRDGMVAHFLRHPDYILFRWNLTSFAVLLLERQEGVRSISIMRQEDEINQ